MGLSEVLILVMAVAVAGFAVGYLAAVLRHGDIVEKSAPDIVEKSAPDSIPAVDIPAEVESESFCRYCKKVGEWPKCHDEADLSYLCFVGRRLRTDA